MTVLRAPKEEGVNFLIKFPNTGVGIDDPANFTVNDNDRVNVVFGQPEYTVAEGETVAIEVALDNPDRTIPIEINLRYDPVDNSVIDSAEVRPPFLPPGAPDPTDYRFEDGGLTSLSVRFEADDTTRTIILDARGDEFFEFTETLVITSEAKNNDDPVVRSNGLRVLISDETTPDFEVWTYIDQVRTPGGDSDDRTELEEDVILTVRPQIVNLDSSFDENSNLVNLGPLDAEGIPRLPIDVTVDLYSEMGNLQVTTAGNDADISGFSRARKLTIGGPDHSATAEFNFRILTDNLIGEGGRTVPD